ncbi:tRNA(Ile)-lysidine synthase [Pseudozobellia thermophila]|uniref:tRNA(Ile)-lysidine synthase n=2 Tax=Pseudozobellia thermophila TaxID=192903 RepID=A0A1M6N4K2_9FLAO|nr:tRNA(Ile)-lysidine synthase [Pseudozobellia thermophila]
MEANFPHLLQEPFLLACSGGVDSMVLLDLCARLDLDFAVAHCNFQLRGEESNADEKLVADVVSKQGRLFLVTHFDTKEYVSKNKLSLQVGARRLRYGWFDALMEEKGISTLVTAHHADDSLETFLINLSRGTGIDGLTGIPEKTEKVSRPLLRFSRQDILKYATETGLQWREDASNADTKYLRNKIRHEIVPLLKELNPAFLENFKSTQKYLSQTADIVNKRVIYLKRRLFILKEGVTRISVPELLALDPLEGYLHAMFKAYGFNETKDLLQLLHSTSGKELCSNTHRLVRDRGHLLLAPIDPVDPGEYRIDENQSKVSQPVSMTIEEVEKIGETGPHILYVDKETLKYPLTVRKWRKGDYFYPFGMQGRKKLSKYFKDEKIDILTKEKQWLLCSAEQLVWVIGRRPDDRFKVGEKTRGIVKITLNK